MSSWTPASSYLQSCFARPRLLNSEKLLLSCWVLFRCSFLLGLSWVNVVFDYSSSWMLVARRLDTSWTCSWPCWADSRRTVSETCWGRQNLCFQVIAKTGRETVWSIMTIYYARYQPPQIEASLQRILLSGQHQHFVGCSLPFWVHGRRLHRYFEELSVCFRDPCRLVCTNRKMLTNTINYAHFMKNIEGGLWQGLSRIEDWRARNLMLWLHVG